MLGRLQKITLFICLALIIQDCAAKTEWHKVKKGLEYAVIEYPRGITFGQVHAFRIDLKEYNLKLSFAHDYDGVFSGVRALTQSKDGWLGINGGFFNPQLESLGLRISDGIESHPLKKTLWWGVFILRGAVPSIVPMKEFTHTPDIDFAIQAGPRLIVDGVVPHLIEGLANRSALGITKNNKLIIVATQNLPLSTSEFATILKSPENANGLDCVNALNLDGGSSTQLYADIGSFHIHVPSFMPVADVIVVVPRSM